MIQFSTLEDVAQVLGDGWSFGAKEVGYLLLGEPDGLVGCIELDFKR